jgi:hypothetical protein
VLFVSCRTIIILALVLWLNIKIICSNYDKQLHKFPTHDITSTACSDVDIVIKRATFLEWNHTTVKHTFESTECQVWHSVWHWYDLLLCVYCNEGSEFGFKSVSAKELLARINWFLLLIHFSFLITCLQCYVWNDKTFFF